jgi:hypothetical protein
VEKKLNIRPKKLIARKQRRFYSYSITLTREQIDWLREQEDVSDLFRKFVDDLMKSVSLEEAKRLLERADLLNYKREALSKKVESLPENATETERQNAITSLCEIGEEIDRLRQEAARIKTHIIQEECRKKDAEDARKKTFY